MTAEGHHSNPGTPRTSHGSFVPAAAGGSPLQRISTLTPRSGRGAADKSPAGSPQSGLAVALTEHRPKLADTTSEDTEVHHAILPSPHGIRDDHGASGFLLSEDTEEAPMLDSTCADLQDDSAFASARRNDHESLTELHEEPLVRVVPAEVPPLPLSAASCTPSVPTVLSEPSRNRGSETGTMDFVRGAVMGSGDANSPPIPSSRPPHSRSPSGDRLEAVLLGDGKKSDGSELQPMPVVTIFSNLSARIRAFFFEAVCSYCRRLVKCPYGFIGSYIVVLGALFSILWRSPEIDEDFSAFVRADGDALRHFDGYSMAAEERTARQGRRLSGDTLDSLFFSRSLTLIYTANAGNILDETVLREIRDFEIRLRGLSKWMYFCQDLQAVSDNEFLCEPGESFSAFAWPSRNTNTTDVQSVRSTVEWIFDGRGSELFPLPALFTYLEREPNYGNTFRDLTRFFPKDFDIQAFLDEGKAPASLRSRYTFTVAFGEDGEAMSATNKRLGILAADFEEFFTRKVHPILVSAAKKGNDIFQTVKLHYTGGVINTFELQQALEADLRMAIGSMVFVSFYMWYHIQSALITLGCALIIFVSVPIAYVLAPAEKTTLASLMSIFLITVIDIDVLYVFVDVWAQSGRGKKDINTRLTWLIIHAGNSCMATSLTTSISFFANLASCLQPLREFGLFMGICVLCVFVLTLLFLPPLFVIRERCRRPVQPRVVDISNGEVGTLAVSGPIRTQVPASPRSSRTKRGCCRCRADGTKRREPCMSRMLNFLVEKIAKWACVVVLATLLCLPIFIIGIATSVEMATGEPVIFPKGHNQVAAKVATGKFESIVSPWKARVERGKVCHMQDFGNSSEERRCSLNWCSASTIASPSDAHADTCWRSQTVVVDPFFSTSKPFGYDIDFCSKVDVQPTLAATTAPSDEAWMSAFLRVTSAIANASTVTTPRNEIVVKGDPLVVENWEQGSVRTSQLYRTDALTVFAPYRNAAGLQSYVVESKNVQSFMEGTRGVEYRFAPNSESAGSGIWASWNDTVRGVVVSSTKNGGGDWLRVGPNLFLPMEVQGVALLVLEAPSGGKCPEGTKTCPDGRVLTRDISKNCAFHECRLVTCRLSVICFSGVPRCDLPGWRMLEGHESQLFPTAVSSMFGSRRLQEALLDITVVWGIRPPRVLPLVGKNKESWGYDPTFEPSNPWAQRAMTSMCEDFPPELLVWTTECWMLLFRQFLRRTDALFPSREFDSKVLEFVMFDSRTNEDLAWFVDDKVKAVSDRISVTVSRGAGAKYVLGYMALWDEYVASQNSKASVTARGAWHTSRKWVEAEAQGAIVNSTRDTLITELVAGWCCMLVFSGDPVLAVLVMSMVFVNMSGLLFFMTVVMQWQIGPLEVIGLVMFIGYSVTYGLHVASNYASGLAANPIGVDDDSGEEEEEEETIENGHTEPMSKKHEDDALGDLQDEEQGRGTRRRKTKLALGSQNEGSLTPPSNFEVRKALTRAAVLQVGGAICSATVTTFGSSLFLVLCTLTIFSKLGLVVVAVTMLSIFFTLVSLTAFLVLFGPTPNSCHRRICGNLGDAFARLTRKRSDSAHIDTAEMT
eukprot:TRINITY_DN30144_c0_g1_i1.p1 TRINITY_DN30144_c0_g1~~TRINITY_DN30144_c0_g1_i1.p1  ORF type:complete len:1586 (+),score=245.41 TRINITY_DN30144_c0_g1_i1:138-4895(+)